jgi:hypothetical protein
MKNITTKKILFLVAFMAAALIAARINFSSVVGQEKQYFTLFQFFGPISGAFLGSTLGIAAVFGSQVIDYLVSGKALTLVNLLRLLPMLFAVYYFSRYAKKDKLSNAVMIILPGIAMLLFMTHPIAGQAWYFALYWLIPIFAVIIPKKVPGKLFFRSLGATFTAHAIGTIAWLYTVPMTAGEWSALVPVVAYERLLFAAGIAASYVIANTVLDYVAERVKLSERIISIDKNYVLSKKAKIFA